MLTSVYRIKGLVIVAVSGENGNTPEPHCDIKRLCRYRMNSSLFRARLPENVKVLTRPEFLADSIGNGHTDLSFLFINR